jgi:hypothetical protein
LGFQKAKRDLKAIYGHSDSESSDNERRKTLYVMFGGFWDITSHHIVKNLRRGGGGHTCPKGSVTPQVDGDVDQL